MSMLHLSNKQENHIIHLGIVVFWLLFWLFNVIDKVISGTVFLWVGNDRYAQFMKYFSSIGIDNTAVAGTVLLFVSFVEFAALVFFTFALWHIVRGDKKKSRDAVFFGILVSISLFSFFTIGDQIFGDRSELLEHSTYWILLVISWFLYTRAE